MIEIRKPSHYYLLFLLLPLVMISYGGILGKVTPSAMLILAIIEPVFYWLNMYIGAFKLKAVDIGGGNENHQPKA